LGLDMYLDASRYVSGWDHNKDEKFDPVLEAFGVRDLVDSNSPHFSIEVCVGYWRKANAIHAWFVNNVQGGEDNCEKYDVSRDQLAELKKVCETILGKSETAKGKLHASTVYNASGETKTYVDGEIITNPEIAQELLPTQEGFFFGGTGYDEWYLDDLRNTIAIVNRCLEADDKWYFCYHSSW